MPNLSFRRRFADDIARPPTFAPGPLSAPRCPHCDRPMSCAPRSLRPIFGNICVFECPPCDYTLLINIRSSRPDGQDKSHRKA
jgi:hypothetical protein